MSSPRTSENAKSAARHESSSLRRFSFGPALGLLVTITVLYFGRAVLMPIAVAFLLSFLLAPPMIRLQRWGFGKTSSALLVVFLTFAMVAVTGYLVLGQAFNLLADLPQYRQNIRTKLHSVNPHSLGEWEQVRQMLGDMGRDIVSLDRSQPADPKSGSFPGRSAQRPVPVEIRQADPSPVQFLRSTLGSIFEPLATAFVVVIFAIFMLLGREDLRDRILRLAGRSRLHVTTQALDDAATRVSRYLLRQLAVNVVYGSLIGIGLRLIGVPHPLLWAIATAVLRFIPYVGPWLGCLGPLLLALAAPGWEKVAWTLGLFFVLEVITANFVEPLLYGASTGISAMAILIAAVFWTWLWGSMGLLLSTPLTVCVVVIGRYVPHLEFLGILFGDEPALSAPQRFYQRMIAMDAEEAAEITERLLKDQSLSDIYDTVLIPALSLAGEGHYAGFLDPAVEEYFLENTRQLVEELGSQAHKDEPPGAISTRLICLPAKDASDEIAARMFVQLLPDSVAAEVVPFSISTEQLLQMISSLRPSVVCVSGVPPQAMRRVLLHCKYLRKHFPKLSIMAAVWSQSDLASVRSRIPVTYANHVVCTMRQAVDYMASIVNPVAAPAPDPEKPQAEQEPAVAENELLGSPESPLQDVLDRITRTVAKALEAPIAILSLVDEKHHCWKSQCGLPADLALKSNQRDGNCDELEAADLAASDRSPVVIEDVQHDKRLAANRFLREKGIHFYASVPILNRTGTPVGSLSVLDTRPRRTTDIAMERLQLAADAAMQALELRTVAPAPLPAEPMSSSD